MLLKISMRNIRRSMRDYAIYFFTLILGVAIFYVFNAIETQTVLLNISEDTRKLVEVLSDTLSAVSVFVAFVLGALVVYASRFLMKRRHGEFALYMLLGMGKGRTAVLLLSETVLIGVVSLVFGLAVGVGLSQVMSAFVADLFDADMRQFTFTFSQEAFFKTILYFGVILLVVLVFHMITIGRSRLITLMQAGKRSESKKAVHPLLSGILFLAAAGMLAYAYRIVLPGLDSIDSGEMGKAILLGCISTFLLFYAVSGFLLFLVMRWKRLYYKGIHTFTIRQISSRIHTMVMSMTIICLMLFVTICVLSAGFSIRSSMNATLQELCPADCNLVVNPMDKAIAAKKSVTEVYREYGLELSDYFKDFAETPVYHEEAVTYGATFGELLPEIQAENPNLLFDSLEPIMAISDYNRIAEEYGNDTYELPSGTYLIVCNFNAAKLLRDPALLAGTKLTVCGNVLAPAYAECQEGFLRMDGTHTNTGIILVPDDVIGADAKLLQYQLVGNYNTTDEAEIAEIEARIQETTDAITADYQQALQNEELRAAYDPTWNSKTQIKDQSIGLGAFATFLGLYIGIVFLMSSAAILALKAMSEQLDSVSKYEMLEKIGVTGEAIDGSLFIQEGTFFFLPLLLAIIHSIVGLKSARDVLSIFGDSLYGAIAQAGIILVVIYGGYFLITFLTSRRMIRR